MTEFLRTLHHSFPVLWWTVLANVLLFLVSLAGLLIDTRLVAGANVWLKPLKFEISIVVFLLTIGWLLLRLDAADAWKVWIARGVSAMMLIEIVAICLQAARGVRSHFNFETPFDGTVFATMGFAIALNTIIVACVLLLFLRKQPQLAPAVLWGIRLGLVLFLLASAQGTMLVRNGAHTVGAPDGGPGLPFAGWSTRFGDLRVAHFAGMHALQILPLLGWLASRTDRNAGLGLVFLAFTVFLSLFSFTLWQALSQRPLLRI